MPSRLQYIDMARGIAILLVVAAHLIQTNVCNGVNSRAFWFINSFHMPLFFAISGYISQKVYQPFLGARSILLFIRKKALALLVPLFVWELLIYKYFLANTWDVLELNDILRVFTKPKLWFLMTLFLIFVVYSLYLWSSARWNKDNIIYKDILLIVAAFLLSGFYYMLHVDVVQVILYSIPFYFGVLISKNELLEKTAFHDYTFAGAFVIFCMLVGHWNMWSGSIVDDILKNLIVAPTAIIVVLNACKKLESLKSSSYIATWGRYSMEIYVAHWCLLSFCEGYCISLIGMNELWLFIIALFVALPIIYACIGLGKLTEKMPLIRLFIFGRRLQRKS